MKITYALGITIVISLGWTSVTQPVSVALAQSNTPNAAMASLQEIFPTRQDFGTEWKIGSLSNHTSAADGSGYRPTTNDVYSTLFHYPSATYFINEAKVKDATGYQGIGYVQRYDRYTEKTMSLWVVSYGFDLNDDAEQYWKTVVANLKATGGFQERQLNKSDAECYTVFYENEGHGQDIKQYCHKANVYYHVEGYTGWTFDSNDEKQISDTTQLVANRISNGVVVPEFPTSAILSAASLMGLVLFFTRMSKKDIR